MKPSQLVLFEYLSRGQLLLLNEVSLNIATLDQYRGHDFDRMIREAGIPSQLCFNDVWSFVKCRKERREKDRGMLPLLDGNNAYDK